LITPATLFHSDVFVLKSNSQLAASVTLFLATALWGIFWLPLRHIEERGIPGVWAVIAINIVPLLFLLPLVIYRRRQFFKDFKTKAVVGLAMGGGMALYAIAILYTTVLRTTLLFYMSPIWATLLAMVILKEQVNVKRWLAITTGFTGLLLILAGKDDSGIATSLNRGDVLALLSGVFWGYGTVIIKKSAEIPAIDLVPGQYFWATVIAVAVLLSTAGNSEFRVPDFRQWIDAAPFVIGFYVVLFLPTIFIATRIAQILSPGRVCLLMMSEVLVAGISAPLFAGESISLIEWFAGLLILAATVIEVYSAPATAETTTG